MLTSAIVPSPRLSALWAHRGRLSAGTVPSNWELGPGRNEKGPGDPGPSVPCFLVASGGEASERAADVALAETLERPVAELADPLTGDTEHRADFLERVLAASLETEVEAQHFG